MYLGNGNNHNHHHNQLTPHIMTKSHSPIGTSNQQQQQQPVGVTVNTSSSSSYDPDGVTCLLCKSKLREPKLLDCLHVYCKSCLSGIAQMFASSKSGATDLATATDVQSNLLITCPKCKQDTIVCDLILSLSLSLFLFDPF